MSYRFPLGFVVGMAVTVLGGMHISRWLRQGGACAARSKTRQSDAKDLARWEPAKLAIDPPYRAKVNRLRWDLIATPLALDDAARVLMIESGTQADLLFRRLINKSQDARYLYDSAKEQEFIVFLHPKRDFIAVYETTPLHHDANLGYTVWRSAVFFEKKDLDELVCSAYRRLVAARRIQRSRAFRDWHEKPKTRDGQLGITCRIALKATTDAFPDFQNDAL